MRRAIRPVLASLTLAFFLSPVASNAQGQTVAPTVAGDEHDWPMYNRDVLGTRFNFAEKTLGPKNVGQLVEKWRFPAKDSEDKIGHVHTVVAVNGCVYFGTGSMPAFYKLGPDGKPKWVYRDPNLPKRTLAAASNGPNPLPSSGFLNGALITRDTVYVGDIGGYIYALDEATGEERWKIDTRAKPFPGAHSSNCVFSSPILAEGNIVIGGGAYEHTVAALPNNRGCTGRGFVVALEPRTGKVVWKYDVGPEAKEFDTPVTIRHAWGEKTYYRGPSTSSVWSTPSYDAQTRTVFFGTDCHNSPRQPTKDDPKLYTKHSCAVIAVDARTGAEKWVTQITANDVWYHGMPAYDERTGEYKDQAIGDTPKILWVFWNGRWRRVVAVGSKNGGMYILCAETGEILTHTPIYTGPPTRPVTGVNPRTLALPSPIGGLQTGCATDGKAVFTNGIDIPGLGSVPGGAIPPTGGRVVSLSLDTTKEFWRHERPKVPAVGGTKEKPAFTDVGDPVGSGIALANGVVYFTTTVSNKLVALDAETGAVLKEIYLGPVWSGPVVSRARVYVGTGNLLFSPGNPREAYFPKNRLGSVICFGLPDEDDAKRSSTTEQKKAPQGDKKANVRVPDDVLFHTADIISEGTRMSAEVFAPKNPRTEKLPTIVMSHGWGGIAAGLRPDAIKFAQAGYLVVAFDYRGWGNSDARLVAVGKPEKKDGKLVAEVKEVREVVDPIDQTTDIMNAINWVVGEKQCDRERIGLWGSSFSGGHVVYVASRDPRVKALVSQVASMDGRWVLNKQLREHTFNQGTARAQGKIGYPGPKEKFGKLTGAPVFEKLVGYAPIEDIGRCKDCAKLFIMAENEELFDNKEHAILAYERATGIKKLVTIKGIKHYGIYNEARDQAQREAIGWFDDHLKRLKSAGDSRKQ
jgi:outer membrane protein assembly factor BamB/dienelactone hydrolase